jgi:malonate-semialdehyde dehydrogenase (acetylating) / methylmalonate-semialdehyde dehydrogenase
MASLFPMPYGVTHCGNLIGGISAPLEDEVLEVESPYTGRAIAQAVLDTKPEEVERTVEHALGAWEAWRNQPLRERTRPLFHLRALLLKHQEQLAQLIASESGKTPAEAFAEVDRGIEVVEFALGLQTSEVGGANMVSRGVTCEYRRLALGVVVGITPFNFPAMVPLWMFPIALTVGNAFILKPSEKVPMTACRLGELVRLAGYPPGLFSILHGGKATVDALLAHPNIQAVGFVGSTPVARSVYAAAAASGKRALCLGGAKNRMIVMPDADRPLTVKAVIDSFTGCAGQRCMAGSVLVTVGSASSIVAEIVAAARTIELGRGMGALINAEAKQRLLAAIELAEQQGALVALDGRKVPPPAGHEGGHWLGATVLDGARPEFDCATRELFGPVLTVIRVDTLEEALEIDQLSPFGNATSIFTQSGAAARELAERSHSGMIGVNVGVPVPRDPFSFGGTRGSKFGHGEITGQGAVEFWSDLKKVTTKWAPQRDSTWIS